MKHLYSVVFALFLLFCVSDITAQTSTPPSSGDGTIGNPYQIATLGNLYWITQNNLAWDKYYIQTANIDASSTSSWDSGSGFSPIGNNSTSFTGSYDGGNYPISGLTISRSSTDYIGMFGFISDGTIRNVTLTEISFSGQDYTAGVVGFSTGSGSSLIENCSVTGSISGRTYVGGLVGATAAGSTITKCYADVTVTSTVSGNNLGGFIGRHTQGSSITKSYSRGNVTSTGGDHVGGFVGSIAFVSPSSPTITNCYSTGNASSYNRAGGFAGSVLSSTITNCFSVGTATIDGGSTVGGFIALNSSGTFNNSFWDTQSSGNASSAAGTGKTTTEMKTQSTFTDAGWDFDAVWEIIGSNYPRLQDNSDPALPVEVISFTVSEKQNGVELQWKTATETNNYGFEVERSVLGHSEPRRGEESRLWNKIGFVEGNGTTNAPKEYTFMDKSISAEKYFYRLKQIDRDGKFSYTQEREVNVGEVSKVFALEQNYPNPFNPTTMINYQLPINGTVSLKVYDAIGRELATLVNEAKEAGNYSAAFDASKLSSGIYFARLQSGDKVQIKKMMLFK